jgi:hypothetical protein
LAGPWEIVPRQWISGGQADDQTSALLLLSLSINMEECAMTRIGNTGLAAWPAVAKPVLLGLVLLLVLSVRTAPAYAKATTFFTNHSEETEIYVFVPYALGGAGEWVDLSGPLHILFVTTMTDQGTFVSKPPFQPQGISGTGETSGNRYPATGETQKQLCDP